MIVSLSRCLAVALLLLGILLRFLYLDADPYYSEWVGYITDEGRWTTHARGFALFGPTFEANWSRDLYLAPLSQLLNYVIFSLSTVSVTSSRPVSAVAGSALLVAFWLLMRAAFLLATALVTGLTNRSVSRAGALGDTRLVPAGAMACIALSIASVAPGYVNPPYSIRGASRHLGELLSGYGGAVSALSADGLFNENKLRYVTIIGEPDWRANRPEVLATVFYSRDSEGILEREYCLVERYPLYVSPEFFRSHPQLDASPDAVTARVYRRGLGGCPRRAS